MKETMKAFPVPSYVNVAGETHDVSKQGMDLRDYFAGMALIGLANMEQDDNVVATLAYNLADAMMKERNRNAS